MSSAAPVAEIAAGDGVVSRRSLTIAALSTIVEWYDFTLYLYFATILSRIFFGVCAINSSLSKPAMRSSS